MIRPCSAATRLSVLLLTLVASAHAESTTTTPTTAPAAAADAVRIVLAGDSTVTDDAGWGQGFAECFPAPRGVVTNMAKGGRSSKSFIGEGRWAQTLALKPQYVLIQFGHNEQPGHGPDRETDPATTYRQFIVEYVDEARAAGAMPILVTPISRRQWGSDGHIHSTLQPYADAVKSVAAERHVPLIDLHARSIEVYESLGKAGCDVISPLKGGTSTLDGTHLNAFGGAYFGPLVADEARRVVPELSRAFRLPPEPTTKPAAATMLTTAPSDATAFTLPAGTHTITVAADGSGDVTSIQAAIAAVPDNSAERTTIHIKPGVYYGFILVPKSKQNVTFKGDDAATTILTYALNVRAPLPPGVTKFLGGTGVVIQGDGFIAETLTFRNTSGDHGQGMALRTDGDRGVYRNCRLLGWQDTLLVSSQRQYFDHCYIEGRVDFIFGGASAVFDGCEIHSKQGGYVTAASTPPDHAYGYLFHNCRLTSDDNVPTYLGRPWRPDASVTFIDCEMGAHIKPEGWHNWGKAENEKTARYAEFNSTGPGAKPEQRVGWSKQLTKDEADRITTAAVVGGQDHWDPTAAK